MNSCKVRLARFNYYSDFSDHNNNNNIYELTVL